MKNISGIVPVILAAVVGIGAVVSLSDYTAPVYGSESEDELTETETIIESAGMESVEETEVENTEAAVVLDGAFDLADGTYEGSANGFSGKIKVSVVIKNQTIRSINILSNSDDAISDKLNVLGILSPMAYKLSNGENYKTAFQKKDELLWTPVAVRRIATNIIYTGTLVQGKFTTPNHKVKTKILKPQEKWAVCHNNHEALVSLRTFQIVQRLLSVDMRMAPGKDSIYLLSGIAVCADCGALMTRKVSTVNGKKYVYYMCSNNKKNKKCSSHRIKEADLESRVFDTLRDMTAILLDADEVIKEAGNSANFRIDQKKTKERISAKEKEITKYNQMLVSLYEDYRDGIVDKSDFAIIKESFEVKRAEAEKAIDRLQKEAENIAAGIERDTEWLEEHRKWKTMPSLTRNVVVSLIQSVKVYEGGDIEIVLDCDDEYRKIVARAGELERQHDAERLVV